MKLDGWTAERRGETRARIVRLLVREPLTVDALSERLGLTRNAVRSQMALLLREGVVEPRGERKGTRRPAAIYGIRSGGDVLLSRAYPILAAQMVRALRRELPPRSVEQVMRAAGKGLAGSAARTGDTKEERMRDALEFLRVLGAMPQVSRREGQVVIESDGCPIGAAVGEEPRSCLAMESMLEEFTGLPVSESCDRGEHPRCRYLVDSKAARGAGHRE